MVQADILQLSAECNTWKEQLGKFRDEFIKDESQLTQAVCRPLSNEQLQQVEHLQNQFHIQLINIHDLRQAIKVHDRKMDFERKGFINVVSDESLIYHEGLLGEYQSLISTLQELRREFISFIQQTVNS